MRVEIIGGGPAGLFLARLLRLADPATAVRVHERNGPDDAFGFGVVFSDRTMSAIAEADAGTHGRMLGAATSWSDMELRLPGGALRFGGYGFTAISRRTLLCILREQAAVAGAELQFHDELASGGTDDLDADVVVFADGVHSTHRAAYRQEFRTTVEAGAAKYAWFGTAASFDAVTFPFVRTEYGTFGAHAYPYGGGLSTFIVEADHTTWLRAGMAGPPQTVRRGTSDEYALAFLSDVFADHLDGHSLAGNNSWWADFHVVRNERWWTGRHVLLGDAAHTAHFSVGSGTKLAMEDAIALARSLLTTADRGAAFACYEAARRPAVARTQAAAERSMRWWETFDRRMHLPAHQFGMHFITRTAAIDFGGLRRRHPDSIAEAETRFIDSVNGPDAVTPRSEPHSALQTPLALGPLLLPNRIAVPMHADDAPVAAGAALALLDARDEPHDLDMIAERLGDAGTALGLVVDDAYRGPLDVPFVEVAATGGELPLSVPVLPDDHTALVVGLTCPREDAWSVDGDRLMESCRALADEGVAGLHLRGDARWDRMLAWADRIRTEGRLAVLVDCPDGWALRVRAAEGVGAEQDNWPTRLHVALLSGRADLAVGRPLGILNPPAVRR